MKDGGLMRFYVLLCYTFGILILNIHVGCREESTQESTQEVESNGNHLETESMARLDMRFMELITDDSDMTLAVDMAMISNANLCPTQWRYSPYSGDELYAFPDDFYRVPPQNQQRAFININPQTAPWIEQISDLVQGNFSYFDSIDGYGLNAGIFLKFTAPIAVPPSGVELSLNNDSLFLLEISEAGDVRRLPYQAQLGDEGKDLYMRPLLPLKEGTQHAVVMTKEYMDATGECISSAQSLQDLLLGTRLENNEFNESMQKLSNRLATLIENASLIPNDLVAVLQFTTHTQMKILRTVAEDIERRTYTWDTLPECIPENTWLRCQASFKAIDYRNPQMIQDASSESSWVIPMTLWLPTERSQAVPVILGAHGINSDRGRIQGVVRHMLPLGYAVIAADAVEHGDHPSRDPDAVGLDALRILGIDLANQKIDIASLRGNFNQTTLDRLQIIELIADSPDIDADGIADLDADQIGYFGISLGAMMGPSLIALSDRIGAAVLAVGGGDLLQFALGNPSIQPLLPLLAQLAGSRAKLDRLILTIQSLLDPADPNTFATRIFENRLSGSSHAPNLLLFVSVFDKVVPPDNAKSLARALQIPLVPDVIESIDLVEESIETPVSYNIEQRLTAGIFQMDRITNNDTVVKANHDNTPFSIEASLQWVEFFETWRQSAVSIIINPYNELQTPSLPN